MTEPDTFAPRPYPRPFERLLPGDLFDGWSSRLISLGSLTRLAADIVLDERQIAVNVSEGRGLDKRPLSPETYPWADTDRGTLLIGCHRNGNEAAFLAALIGRVPSKELKVFAKPYGLIAKGLATWAARRREVGELVMNSVLPVVPSRIARERHPPPWKQLDRLYWRFGMGQKLPSLAEIKDNNARSTAAMASHLGRGGAGVLFPTGHVGDAAKGEWRTGAAATILALDAHRRSSTDISLFRFGSYSWLALAKAVLYDRPIDRNAIGLELAPAFTVEQALAGKDPADPALPLEMTAYLQQTYREYFGSAE